MGPGKIDSESPDCGIIVYQLLLNGQRPTALGLSLVRLTSICEHEVKTSVCARQASAKRGDAGVSGDQLLINRHRLSGLGLCLCLHRLSFGEHGTEFYQCIGQLAADVVRGFGGCGQCFLVGPRKPVGCQAVGGSAGREEELAYLIAASR